MSKSQLRDDAWLLNAAATRWAGADERQWVELAALAEPDRRRMDELARRIDKLRAPPLPPRRSPPPSPSDVPPPPPRRAPLARAESSDL